MIDKRFIELVLTEQKEEAELRLSECVISRDEENLVNLDSDLAQVVMGVRRCGKSTLCFNVLKKSGVKFGYVNFDDERLISGSVDDLNNILEILYKINGHFTHLFLDEAQNIEGWHLFVNRLLRKGMKILITGSNAKLLSHELSTHLTGRYDAIEVFPFSFKEFCEFNSIDRNLLTTSGIAVLRDSFDRYLKSGGFPEILKGASPKRYIDNLTGNILNRDIRQRYKLRYFSSFSRLSYHLLNVVPYIVSVANLSELVGIKSPQTIKNYIDYLTEAYLLLELKKFSFKSRLRLTDEKLYAIDVALMDNRRDAMSAENIGWRLETIIFLHLIRRSQVEDFDLFYYKKDSRSKECDFLKCKGNKVEAIYQVAYSISNPKTKKREINALLELAQSTGCEKLYLVTDFEREILEIDTKIVKIIPAYEYLLQ